MLLSDLKSKLSARVGYTIDSSSKPTEAEVESFIHEAVKKVVNIIPAELAESLVTSSILALSASGDYIVATLPSDYNKFVSMFNLTQSSDIDLLPPTKIAQLKSGYDSVLLPDYCAVREGNTLIFKNTDLADDVYLAYQKDYTSSDIGNISNNLEGAVLAYSYYLIKMQDEEAQDSQFANQEFIQELQLLGADVGGRTND